MNAELVRQALATSFPALQVNDCRYLSEGWDSAAWEVNGNLIFRFPKRAEVATWLRREIALLPALAAALPVPIPHFIHLALSGAPTDPTLPFVGYRKLEGVFLDTAPQFLHPASPLLSPLAAFLRALHAFPHERAIVAGLPAATWETWLAHWHTFAERTMRDDDPALDPPTRAWVASFRAAFLAELDLAECPLALTHHDLALEHILADPTGTQITGVIDWGDLALGDPALDFAGFAGTCDTATLAALLVAYGPVDDGFQRRARWYARLAPFHLLHFGQHTGDPTTIAAGYAAIRRVSTGNDEPSSSHGSA